MKQKRIFSKLVMAAVVVAISLLPITPLGVAKPALAQTVVKTIKQPLASAARTSSDVSSWIDLPAGDDHVVAYLTVTATTGGTLNVKLQDSPDGGTTAFDLTGASFAQVSSGSSSQTVYATRVPAGKVRVNYTIAGGGFTFHVEILSYRGSPTIVSSTDANASNLTAGTLPTLRLNEDIARTITVTVPTASVLTLNTTPYTLISAPGAGKITLIDEITCKLVFNSVAYTGSNAIELRYTNGSGAKVTADLSSAFLNSASGTNYATVKSVVTQLTPVANAAIVVFVPTANPGAGNSDLVFSIKYRVVTP
jgi:hypothetical protein